MLVNILITGGGGNSHIKIQECFTARLGVSITDYSITQGVQKEMPIFVWPLGYRSGWNSKIYDNAFIIYKYMSLPSLLSFLVSYLLKQQNFVNKQKLTISSKIQEYPF